MEHYTGLQIIMNWNNKNKRKKIFRTNLNDGHEPNEQNYHYDIKITISIMKFIKQNKQKLIDVVKLNESSFISMFDLQCKAHRAHT